MATQKVSSEILSEKDVVLQSVKEGNNAVSKFVFKYPPHMRKKCSDRTLKYDEDGDLILERREEGSISIEHSTCTELKLVGLQIWRGALLLGDYILSQPELFQNKVVLELGSGVGFDTIIAGMIAKEVICTDVDLGGILKLIEKNIESNKSCIKCKTCVTELNFLDDSWNPTIMDKVKSIDVIMAADVIYDDKITAGFVSTLARLLNSTDARHRVAYVALEKRYVFTIADLDAVAPMYEEFLRCIDRAALDWKIEELKLDFPQYFKYDRLKQLALLKIEKRS
ncbi:methyltransferase-like protein 22 [Phymastichus coffea]|uniref:methyltransferase-like protein 22 n=1 Tax=Phymastichus coffea TaxID=108790 RepID=UPI00273BFEA0|nr:methyltransferase-like protein 22 [Phymastichus coffea]XP_058792796.1 methyltransferase-like protein 22 [Phymastichus coffea]XP_058792797.1 methyltransferase-like protein 22 [Phymastichus coffea]XP_058792798.1 methyltransferase-like protein 22 [Phymastichus coffea]XP_058792799.1 methyltransferase-like protein 22 [Phymastichus coffea]